MLCGIRGRGIVSKKLLATRRWLLAKHVARAYAQFLNVNCAILGSHRLVYLLNEGQAAAQDNGKDEEPDLASGQ
jgi:hypothetical protein